MTARPRLYFSFRSPYSWLAVRRLREVAPALETAVDLYPYWDPDELTRQGLKRRGGQFHYVQMSRAKHLYLLYDTRRLAEAAGVTMAWPVDVDPWWELPHLAWLVARREGLARAFYDALTEERWGRGGDICDPAVVREAARRAGLPPELAVRAPEEPDVREEGVAALHQAYLDDVFGIPYLKWGRHRFWGLDRVDAFVTMWRNGSAPHPGSPDTVAAADPTAGQPYDTDSAGGCG